MTLTDWTTMIANIATVGTLLLAWFYARKINVNVEKRKNEILKEKEWQVVWAVNMRSATYCKSKKNAPIWMLI